MQDVILTVEEVTICRVGRLCINFMRRFFGITTSEFVGMKLVTDD